MATSLGPTANLEWLTSLPAPEGFYGMDKFVQSIDTKILGRKTYEWSRRMGAKFEGPNQYFVFSCSIGLPQGVEFLSEAVAPFVARLREQPGKDIWLMGGGEVIASFLDETAIDEFVITVAPVFIGEGIPLIAKRHRHVPLGLVATERFRNGVVQNRYCVQS